jgi:cytochrome bd-type quinol oxidase subunit 2
MTINTIIAIAAIVALVAMTIVLGCLYLKGKTKDEIRTDVYKLFKKAEKRFESGQGAQKFTYVVQLARSLLPRSIQKFVTVPVLQALFERLIQELFDEFEDFLDDGKMNDSVKEE